MKIGQYPVWMTRKPRKGYLRRKTQKISWVSPSPDPARRCSFRKSVSIYPKSAPEDVGLWPFYSSYVKKRQIVLLQNFLKWFSEITSALLQHLQLNYVSCNVKVDSLTFINFQENYQTAEIYFYLYHVTPLNTTVSNYCVN